MLASFLLPKFFALPKFLAVVVQTHTHTHTLQPISYSSRSEHTYTYHGLALAVVLLLTRQPASQALTISSFPPTKRETASSKKGEPFSLLGFLKIDTHIYRFCRKRRKTPPHVVTKKLCADCFFLLKPSQPVNSQTLGVDLENRLILASSIIETKKKQKNKKTSKPLQQESSSAHQPITPA